ncbi:MAG TPA: hypothetical protein VHF58_03225 [Solirubrobacterales bacterium]|nr:hypothetical protein [Solirubrobacterales bacterium]
MTRHKSFKRLVRNRMEKTGESYTAARASLLSSSDDSAKSGEVVLPLPDETIRERTGHGWEEWFDLLDEWGAADRPRPEISRWVADQLDGEQLGWNAQAVTLGYERARLGRAIGERADGFALSASKTVAVPVERLYEAFVEDGQRTRWLPDGRLRERTATRPKSARFDWGDGSTRVHVAFDPKGEAKSTVVVEHRRLADADELERMRAYWRERLSSLKATLEGVSK